MSTRLSSISALMLLRAAAAHVVELTDAALLGTKRDARMAKQTLPAAIRILQLRAERAQATLETEEGQS